MSYLDPQRWGDVDAGGNAVDWKTREGKLLHPAYEMLRKAAVERLDAGSFSVPAILQVARAPGRIYTSNWFGTFHSAMTSLITGSGGSGEYDSTSFVNHTDNGGNWNGVSDSTLPWGGGAVSKQWTEADILAAIGDSVRIPAPKIPRADWSLQQYKLLNKLRWSVEQSEPINGAIRNYAGRTQAEAAANWFLGSWNPAGRGPVGGYGSETGGLWAWEYDRRRYNHQPNYDSPATMSCGIDFYIYPRDVVTGGTQVYDDEGQETPGNSKWWLFDTVSSAGPGGKGSSRLIGGLSSLPPTPTILPGSRGWMAHRLLPYAGAGLLGLSVKKWDGIGGFKFLDK